MIVFAYPYTKETLSSMIKIVTETTCLLRRGCLLDVFFSVLRPLCLCKHSHSDRLGIWQEARNHVNSNSNRRHGLRLLQTDEEIHLWNPNNRVANRNTAGFSDGLNVLGESGREYVVRT